jgi:ubiquinone/menaquinone biosynthesis C-methylase UbiE
LLDTRRGSLTRGRSLAAIRWAAGGKKTLAVPVLSREQARRVYDRIGSRQDTQAFYEDRATEILIQHGEFGAAHRVLEFGCGTGRFAVRLLSHHLPAGASYRALDLSPNMVQLARARLAPFGPRAEAIVTDGSPPTSEPAGSRDRFVSNFVLDLLSEEDIAAVVGDAHRILVPGGLLCVASLSSGSGVFSGFMSRVWSRVHRWRPALVGGCRPLELRAWVTPPKWEVRHHSKLAPFGVPSEVVVAARV